MDKKPAPETGAPKQRSKATFVFPNAEFEELQKAASERGISMTDIVRRAIKVDLFVTQKLNEGGTLILEDKEGQRTTVAII